jgi:hypothetical protein
MKLNIFNEITIEPIDYLNLLTEEINKQSYITIRPNLDTAHGIYVERKLPKNGIYLIYKIINGEYKLLYVGLTDNSIYQRLGRYVAAVRDTQRHDENHAGGEKHREILGEDLDDMFVKYIHLDFSTLVDVVPRDLENLLIEKLQPLFNNENYYNYQFEKQLKIVKR